MRTCRKPSTPRSRVLTENGRGFSRARAECHWRGLWLASVFIGHQAAFALASQSPRQWHQVAPGGAFLLVPKLPLGHARPRSFRFASAACSACRRGEAGASGSCAQAELGSEVIEGTGEPEPSPAAPEYHRFAIDGLLRLSVSPNRARVREPNAAWLVFAALARSCAVRGRAVTSRRGRPLGVVRLFCRCLPSR